MEYRENNLLTHLTNDVDCRIRSLETCESVTRRCPSKGVYFLAKM